MANKKNMLVLVALLLSVFCALNSCMENIPQEPALGMWHDQAMQHIQNKAYDSALLVLDSAVKMQEAVDYPGSLGRAHHLKAYIYQVQEKEDQSLTHYYHALDAYKKTNKVKVIGELLNNMGKIYVKSQELEKALKHYQEAYSLLKNDQSQALKILNNIARTYYRLEDYDQALKNYNKALELEIVSNNPFQKANLLNNIGEAYWHKNEYDLAKENYLQALRFHKESGKDQQVAYTLNNLALVYQETKQWNHALDYLQKSVQIHKKYNAPYLTSSYNNLAELYLEKEDFQKANHYLDKALAFNSSKLEDQSRTLELKSIIAEAQGKFQQSADYQKQVVALKNTMIQEQMALHAIENKNQMLIAQVEDKVRMSRIEREKAIQETKVLYQEKINRLITIAVIVALAGMMTTLLMYWRTKQLKLQMEDYTKNIAHTIRNQLNTIGGRVFMAKSYLNRLVPSASREEYSDLYEDFDSIKETVDYIAETSTDLIETENVSKLKSQVDLYDPATGIETNIQAYSSAAREKDITLKEEIISEPMVTAHATTFEHALGNLVSNAIKYSPEGSTIILRLYDEDGQVLLTVLDEGPGIPEKHKKKLFKKGKKLHNIKNIISSGVGLYYAKRDIEKMGGQMYHKNRKEGGSAFTIEFPRKI